MAHYLIEFRFQSKKMRTYLDGMVHGIKRNFGVGKRKHVPHITLVGPLNTNNEKRLVCDFARICSQTKLMKFKGDGFGTFDNAGVVFVNIKASDELNEFRIRLADTLRHYCTLQSQDKKDEKDKFKYHSTLAMKLSTNELNSIKKYIETKPAPNFTQVVMRVTLLRGGRILREYDFLQRKLFDRRHALDRRNLIKSKILLKKFFSGQHNPNKQIKIEIPAQIKVEPTTQIEPIPQTKIEPVEDMSVFDRILHWFGKTRKPKTFVTSDLHLDHANIIRFCKRPFDNVKNMNEALVRNWNNVVGENDTVYIIGDFVYNSWLKKNPYKHKKRFEYWSERLNGKKIFIKGSHDPNYIKLDETQILEYGGHKFFLIHEPEKVPKDWQGWAICGHHHNHRPQEYPFINKQTKRINVSVELTGYKPVDMDEIIQEIEK